MLPVRECKARLAQAAGLGSRTAPEPESPALAGLLDLPAPSPSSSFTTSTCPSGADADDTASAQDPISSSSMGFDSLGRSYSGATSLAAPSSGATARTCTTSGTAAPDSARRQHHKAQQQQQQQQQQQVEDEARWQQAWQTWVREAALLVNAHDARPNELYVKRVEEAFARLKAAAVYGCAKHPELICNMCVRSTVADDKLAAALRGAGARAGLVVGRNRGRSCRVLGQLGRNGSCTFLVYGTRCAAVAPARSVKILY